MFRLSIRQLNTSPLFADSEYITMGRDTEQRRCEPSIGSSKAIFIKQTIGKREMKEKNVNIQAGKTHANRYMYK